MSELLILYIGTNTTRSCHSWCNDHLPFRTHDTSVLTNASSSLHPYPHPWGLMRASALFLTLKPYKNTSKRLAVHHRAHGQHSKLLPATECPPRANSDKMKRRSGNSPSRTVSSGRTNAFLPWKKVKDANVMHVQVDIHLRL